MKILFATPEAVPFAKTGGLADVAGALPKEVAALGDEISVILPLHRKAREIAPDLEVTGIEFEIDVHGVARRARILRGKLPSSSVTAFLVEHDPYFDRQQLYGDLRGDYADNCERFAFFSRAVLEFARRSGEAFALVHCNDWHTALIPVYLDYLYRDDPAVSRLASVLTIHNVGFQGLYPAEQFPLLGLPREAFNWRELEFFGKINFLKGGVVHADLVTTVSRTYALEIQTPEFGAGLDGVLRERSTSLVGVLNGVDYSVWNPETDPLIAENYSSDRMSGKALCKRAVQKRCGMPLIPDIPLFGMISRLTDYKGIDLLAAALEPMLREELQFVLLGTGEERYHKLLLRESKKYRGKASFHVSFDDGLAHEIEAGADFFLMPSRYEPCGLNQLISLGYGTIPIARATGGLRDTIVAATPDSIARGQATGFLFEEYSPEAFLRAIRAALDVWRRDRRGIERMRLTGMLQDESWRSSARRYAEVYRDAARRAHPGEPVEPLPRGMREAERPPQPAPPAPARPASPPAFEGSPFEDEPTYRDRDRRSGRRRRNGRREPPSSRSVPSSESDQPDRPSPGDEPGARDDELESSDERASARATPFDESSALELRGDVTSEPIEEQLPRRKRRRRRRRHGKPADPSATNRAGGASPPHLDKEFET